MKYSEARQGRVFILRLEDGEIVHEVVEQFALDHGVKAASLIVVGGADDDSRLVVGPEEDRGLPLNPMKLALQNAHEVTGTGTLFQDEDGQPLLHMHMACGRGFSTATGCIRNGVKCWQVMEVVLYELTGSTGVRRPDAETGFELLIP